MARGFRKFYRKVNDLPEPVSRKKWRIVDHLVLAEDLFKFIIQEFNWANTSQVTVPISPDLVMLGVTWTSCTDQPYRYWSGVHRDRVITIDEDLYDWAKFQLENLYQGEANG